MNEQHYPEAAGISAALLAKFLPAGLGALVMVAVDLPKTKRELFARLFVAFVVSLMLGDVAFDFLHTFSWFSFLDATKRSHTSAVDFIMGGVGWFVMGGTSMWLRKFRVDPAGAVAEAKEAAKP